MRIATFARHSLMLTSAIAISLLTAATASAQSQRRAAADNGPWSVVGKNKLNEWTVGLAAGRTEGAPLRLASELARVLDDGEKMRVLPIVTRGPFHNMADLLLLKGVDAAILLADTLEHYEKVEKVPRLQDRVTYLANLFPSEVHILARPEIKSIEDLAGKKVNFNSAGTAAAYTGPLIFKKLGIKITEAFDPHPQAVAAMRKGDEYAATFWVTTKPIDPFVKQDFPAGFKLLSVPYARELEDIYLPAALEHKDYPKLIPEGEKVQTVSVPTVLAIYNWQPGNERYKRMARFVDYMFERLPQLQQAPYDSAWKSVSLQAPVPGWKRHALVQQKLDQLAKVRSAQAPKQ
jgi:ABC-type amino acid transport substrate-binding protein